MQFQWNIYLRQHRTIHGLRLKCAFACPFSVILHKNLDRERHLAYVFVWSDEKSADASMHLELCGIALRKQLKVIPPEIHLELMVSVSSTLNLKEETSYAIRS